MGSQVNWKSRYAELLQQQERQSQRHKKKNSLLTTALIDVSSLARGIDQAADDKLLAMLALLRRVKLKNVDLEPAVIALSKQTKASLELRRKSIRLIFSRIKKLTPGVKSLPQEDAAVNTFRELEKLLAAKSKHYSELPQALDKLVALHKFHEKARKDTGRAGPGWTWAWRSWLSPSPYPETVEQTQRSDPESSPESSPESKPAAHDPVLPSNLSASVCRLLQQISPPADVSEVYQSACMLLDTGITREQLPELILAVCEVVDATLRSDRDDFESFLSELNERLLTFREVCDDEIASGQVLDKSIREQFGQLRSSVSLATDLDQLKVEVSANVDRMMSIMDASQELKPQASLSKELDSLVERVKSMERATRAAETKIAEQRRIALTDSLTQLPNREAYNRRASEELSRWQRYERPLCLAVCDIDFFKKVNDNYGHVAGDEVLKDIASMLRSRLRENDFVARFGGEEFVVLLPETEKQQALQVMEAVREAIEEHSFCWQEEQLDITVSIGIANFKGKDNLESAFTRADKALYSAKDSGRNRCQIALD